jgi:hypothetical protein
MAMGGLPAGYLEHGDANRLLINRRYTRSRMIGTSNQRVSEARSCSATKSKRSLRPLGTIATGSA